MLGFGEEAVEHGSTLQKADHPASTPCPRMRGASAACITARCITTASSGA